MPTEEKLGIIIPTKDRPKDLGRVLNSISGQDCKPERVLVVDGGSAPVRDIVDNFRGLNIEYVRVFPHSLTAQRNAGIKRILRDVSIVIFFDDDVILEEGCLRNMKRFWESAPGDVGGAGFNIVNVPPERPTILQKIFMVNSEEPGRILRSGFQSRIPFLDKTIPVQWIVGCAMAWRSSVFDEFMFDEWFSGYARYE